MVPVSAERHLLHPQHGSEQERGRRRDTPKPRGTLWRLKAGTRVGVLRAFPRAGETEARCPICGPKPSPHPQQRAQGARLQECTGRAIKGSVIKSQQSQKPAPSRGGEQKGGRGGEKKKEKPTHP